MNLRTASILAALALPLVSVRAAGQDVVELKPGFVAERSIRGGEIHRYTATLNTGTVLRVIADQRGVDVVLKLYGPDGAKIRVFDGPTGPNGPDELYCLSDAAGSYKIEIVPFSPEAPAGKYEIRVAEMRPATPQELAGAATRKVLAGLEREWDDAVRATDLASMDRLMADDYVGYGSLNSTRTQAKQSFAMMADMIKKLKVNVLSHGLTDTNIEIAGDTAVTTGRSTMTMGVPGHETTEGGHFLHLWQKRGGAWRLVGDHWDPEGELPLPVKAVALSAAELDSLAGTYHAGTALGATVTVTRVEGGIGLTNEFAMEPYLPASPTEFFSKSDPDTRALFLRDETGHIVEVLLVSGGRVTRARRLDAAR